MFVFIFEFFKYVYMHDYYMKLFSFVITNKYRM